MTLNTKPWKTFSCFLLTLLSFPSLLIAQSEPPSFLLRQVNIRQIYNVSVLIEETSNLKSVLDHATGRTIDEVEIIDFPKEGKVNLKDDYVLNYQPQRGVCEKYDQIRCLVKLNHGTDTVDVNIEILCEPYTILSGFTPGGGGKYDTFTIKGVEKYPNNTLSIYDKNGVEVFRQKGYANNWDGRELKDQIDDAYLYYYVFEDGEGNNLSGTFRIDS